MFGATASPLFSLGWSTFGALRVRPVFGCYWRRSCLGTIVGLDAWVSGEDDIDSVKGRLDRGVGESISEQLKSDDKLVLHFFYPVGSQPSALVHLAHQNLWGSVLRVQCLVRCPNKLQPFWCVLKNFMLVLLLLRTHVFPEAADYAYFSSVIQTFKTAVSTCHFVSYARLRQQPFWSIVQFMMRIQSALADAHPVSPWMGEVIPPSFNCLKCMKQLKDWISRKASTSSARKNGAVLHTHMPYATALCLIQSDTLHLGSDNYTDVFYLALGATLFANKKGFR